jgi:hypothetical protein
VCFLHAAFLKMDIAAIGIFEVSITQIWLLRQRPAQVCALEESSRETGPFQERLAEISVLEMGMAQLCTAQIRFIQASIFEMYGSRFGLLDCAACDATYHAGEWQAAQVYTAQIGSAQIDTCSRAPWRVVPVDGSSSHSASARCKVIAPKG